MKYEGAHENDHNAGGSPVAALHGLQVPIASRFCKKKKEEENDESNEEQETENGGRGTEAQSQGGEEAAGEESTA